MDNPAYSKSTFLGIFPQFRGPITRGEIPESVLNFYIKLANNSLSYSRWGDQWEMGMTLFVAHYITLYSQAIVGLDVNSPIQQVVSNSLAQGLVASKSVGSLSKSYDYNSINDDFAGDGTWKLTTFGQQFVTIARLMGKGGSYIW